jgi:methionine sulfoxide reductase heme-binding subunit
VTGRDPALYGWWLASRASGVVALALVTLSVAVGLAMAGRVARRPGLARRLRGVHEHVALVGLAMIAVHGVTLLGDHWLHPGLRGIAIPFWMSYRPAATGAGILAGYLAAALGLSFYARRRIGARRWRRLHRLTVAVYALAVVHALGAGTDAAALRAPVLATTVPIALLLARRLTRGRGRAPAAIRHPVSAREGAR